MHIQKFSICATVLTVASFSCLSANAWAPVRIASVTNDVPPMLTRWGKAVNPENVLREYPRPQMERSGRWSCLNGLWRYAVVARNAGCPETWQGDILVPFAVDPLFPPSWDYLVLENLRYHGQDVDIRWRRGKGLQVFVNGKEVARRDSIGGRLVVTSISSK